jgi:V8-like Glu-specific endopeptidase
MQAFLKGSVMNPEQFLEDQADVIGLIGMLTRFAERINSASDRRDVLMNANVSPIPKTDTNAYLFASSLVSEFKQRCISVHGVENLSAMKLLRYIEATDPQDNYGLLDEDIELIRKLIKQGTDRFAALQARRAVGKIETEQGDGFGTGILIAKNLLLTCWHIFTKTDAKWARIRFGNKVGCDGRTVAIGTAFDLDLENIIARGGGTRPDYALIQIKGATDQPSITLIKVELNDGQPIRTIHHPKGAPAVVSDWGHITQVGRDYIDHDIETAEGSSGAPIFNEQWELIAIHRGDPTFARQMVPGTMTGVPISAIWDSIQSHIML